MKLRVTIVLLGMTCCLLAGCGTANTNVARLRQENAQLTETLRQDRVRLANLEEQNRRLSERLADAEKSVALLHDAPGSEAGVKRR